MKAPSEGFVQAAPNFLMKSNRMHRMTCTRVCARSRIERRNAHFGQTLSSNSSNTSLRLHTPARTPGCRSEAQKCRSNARNAPITRLDFGSSTMKTRCSLCSASSWMACPIVVVNSANDNDSGADFLAACSILSLTRNVATAAQPKAHCGQTQEGSNMRAETTSTSTYLTGGGAQTVWGQTRRS